MLEGRLPSTLEGLLFALLVAGLFILVSVVARFAFGKTIGLPRSYAVVVVCAFALHRVLVVVFPEEPSAPVEPPHRLPRPRRLETSMPRMRIRAFPPISTPVAPSSYPRSALSSPSPLHSSRSVRNSRSKIRRSSMRPTIPIAPPRLSSGSTAVHKGKV